MPYYAKASCTVTSPMAPTLPSLLHGRGILKALLPAAALTGAMAIGAPSAHALATGNLAISNGASDFFSEVKPCSGADLAGGCLGYSDTFVVTFNQGSNLFLSTANGLFVPPFPAAPPFSGAITLTSPTVATFQWVNTISETVFPPIAGGGALNLSNYKLVGDTAFSFSNGATVGLFDGVEFVVTLNTGVGPNVQVLLTQSLPPDQTAFVSGLGQPVTVTDGAFTFNDTAASGGGSWSANIDVEAEQVPGPLPILGAGVAFGYSRRLRKRVKSGASA